MFRKNYISIILFIAFFTIGSISVVAQKDIGGKVTFKDSNDKVIPFEGAKVDCYRIDVRESCGSAMTDKSGKFTLKAIPNKAKIVLVASGKGLSPQVTVNVRMDDSNMFEMVAGDGAVPTEDATRQVALTYAQEQGTLTEAQKKELADLEKKRKEIEERNKKAESNNKLWGQLLKEGNEAFKKGDFDTAIAKYEEGYNIDSEFIGSAPVFLNNKASALKKRSVDAYNIAAKSKDSALKSKTEENVAKDFKELLDITIKSYNMLMNADKSKINNSANHKKNIQSSISIIKDAFRIISIIKLNLANYVSTSEDADKLISIYKTSLKILPKNNDVLGNLGVVLFTASAITGNTAQEQESLDYMNVYQKKAPKNHKMQEAVSGLVTYLKNERKLKPKKIKID